MDTQTQTEEQIKREAVQAVEITRAIKSKQPRLGAPNPDAFLNSVINWLVSAVNTEVPYGSLDNRERDRWLSEIWMKEPHLAGVLNGAVLIDANRGWTFVGGRNQVNRYINIMHDLENGQGYRYFIRQQALAYRVSDLGAISEIGREGRGGPMRTLWYVDPTRCRLTGNGKYPLSYKPEVGGDGDEQGWQKRDYFRVVSMPSTREKLRGLGFCGLSRAIELTKTMIGILRLDNERLLAKLPVGMLLLQGISQDQWDKTMGNRDYQLAAMEREYFGGVFTFASMQEIKAQFMALANYPEQFDREKFTNLLMYGYALALGYSPDEFWPVQFGALGRGTEAELQHRKATAKGGMDFIVMFQEQLQDELPDTLLFQFDERDVEGEVEEAELRAAQVGVIRKMYDSVAQQVGLIDRDEARTLLAEMGLIPPEWTEVEENVTASDYEPAARDARMRRVVATDQVQRAAWLFQDEPLVEYRWPENQVRTITPFGKLLVQRRSYSLPSARGKRRAEDDVLFEDDDVTITEGDVTEALEAGKERVGLDFFELMNAGVYDEPES